MDGGERGHRVYFIYQDGIKVKQRDSKQHICQSKTDIDRQQEKRNVREDNLGGDI